MADAVSASNGRPARRRRLVRSLTEADIGYGAARMIAGGDGRDGGRRERRVVEWQGLSEEQRRWMVGRRRRIISIHLERQLARAP